MSIEEILKILMNENLVVDFLGFNDPQAVIDLIIRNKKIRDAVKRIPKSFWDDAKEKGIIIFRDFTYVTKNGEQECIDNRYIDIEGRNHTPALVYQKRRSLKAGY